mmetsp:Transcript_50314/g.155502  ORF Transcript_50314/g.155502 Transcript_50314/m.155502 type:complete len:255 (-) Transcript_50314:2-766(-)
MCSVLATTPTIRRRRTTSWWRSCNSLSVLLKRLAPNDVRLTSILASSGKLIIRTPKVQCREISCWCPKAEKGAVIVNEHEACKMWWGPHQLEGDARLELDVSHVLRRIKVATIGASAPRSPGAEFLQACNLNSGAQAVAVGDAPDLTGVQVVGHLPQHGSEVTMVVIVEGVPSVALPGPGMWQVLEAARPEEPAPDLLPLRGQLPDGEALDAAMDVPQSLHSCARILRVDLHGGSAGPRPRGVEKGANGTGLLI